MKLERMFETNDGRKYIVKFVRATRWPEIVIYRYNPEKILFGRKVRVHSELECIAMYIASQKFGIDTQAVDALEQVAKNVLEGYLNSIQQQAAENRIRRAQEENFMKG